jgi:hypothetical protein
MRRPIGRCVGYGATGGVVDALRARSGRIPRLWGLSSTAIDKKRQTVTLEGPEGGKVTLKVQDPANLERAQVGHLVEATYREAVSISVEKPAK